MSIADAQHTPPKMSFVKAYFHIVINTKYKAANLNLAGMDKLYAYLAGIIKNHKSEVIAINGTSNYIHILINLDATLSLAELMRDLKQFSSRWLHEHPELSKFDSWGKEYYATSLSYRDFGIVKKYIANQREHHGCVSFEDEMRRIVDGYGGDGLNGWKTTEL